MSKESILKEGAALYLPKLSELFKVLGDNTRLRILYLLMNGACKVCEITEATGMEQSAISHQLRVLRKARLVTCEKKGKNVFYSLDDDHVNMLIGQGIEHVMHN